MFKREIQTRFKFPPFDRKFISTEEYIDMIECDMFDVKGNRENFFFLTNGRYFFPKEESRYCYYILEQ